MMGAAVDRTGSASEDTRLKTPAYTGAPQWDPAYPLDEGAAQTLINDALVQAFHAPTISLEGASLTSYVLIPHDLKRPCVLVIGAFDGLHLGHRELVERAVEDAHSQGLPCIAVSFDPDPAEVLGRPRPSSRLLGSEERAQGLLALGVDATVRFTFTRELAQLGMEEFVRDKLCVLLAPVAIHVGTNFSFGRGGKGTPEELARLGEHYGFTVFSHGLLPYEGEVISSTRIRALLAQGDLKLANALLGRAHYIKGRVEHGRGEGRAFGFPTANVVSHVLDALPQEGVYAAYFVLDDQAWPAAVNVGAPPTFSAPRPAFLEANLIGFRGDLYSSLVKVIFVERIRASKHFSSTEELKRVVFNNIEWVEQNLGDVGLEV